MRPTSKEVDTPAPTPISTPPGEHTIYEVDYDLKQNLGMMDIAEFDICDFLLYPL